VADTAALRPRAPLYSAVTPLTRLGKWSFVSTGRVTLPIAAPIMASAVASRNTVAALVTDRSNRPATPTIETTTTTSCTPRIGR
jgi:hypothetical protein